MPVEAIVPKFMTVQSITAVAVAALVAGLVAFLPSGPNEAKAETQKKTILLQPQARGQSPSALTGAGCASRPWPDYEQNCLFDLRPTASNVPPVRLIALQ
jgi:hypothetical protein